MQAVACKPLRASRHVQVAPRCRWLLAAHTYTCHHPPPHPSRRSASVGDGDGMYKGKRYFRCPDGHGAVLPLRDVISVLSSKTRRNSASRLAGAGSAPVRSIPAGATTVAV